MTSPSFNYFYRVELTIASFELGDIKAGTTNVRELITRTYNFVNKSLRDASTASDRETYLPILKTIGEVTLAAGEILPTASLSSIVIDDARGSFSADRKFSDLLERFTPIGQTVNIYVGESPTETDMPSSWLKIGTGKVQSWSRSISTETPLLNFQIEPFKISDRIMNLEVSRDISGMENAPDASIGKALPLLFPKPVLSPTADSFEKNPYVQSIPVRISADGAETAVYAVSTEMYQSTKNKFSNLFYVKKNWEDGEDIWARVGTVATSNYKTPVAASYYTLNTYDAYAFKIPTETVFSSGGDTQDGWIVTGVTFSARGQGSTSRVSAAYLTGFILQVDPITKSVVAQLASGRASLANYDANNNVLNSTFDINISFDASTVIQLTSTRTYDFYIGFSATGVTAGDLILYKRTSTAENLIKDKTVTANSLSDWAIGSSSSNLVAHQLRVVSVSKSQHVSTYTRDGFTYSKLTLTQPAADVGQVNPELDSLELVVESSGFNDYATNAAIASPQDVFKRLSYKWDGESWSDDSAVDTTTLATSHYDILFSTSGNYANGGYRARYLAGIIENKSTYSQVISELARGTASKIGILSDGKFFIYPWGTTVSPAYNIPESDIIPLSWETRTDDSVINRTLVTFERTYATNISQTAGDNFKYAIDFASDTYLPVAEITERSRSIYGVKDVEENQYTLFGYSDKAVAGTTIGLPGYLTGVYTSSQPQIGNLSEVAYSVDFLAEYYLARFALPFVYCSFVVPWHRYKNIKMFDVITFSHSEFPAFYGTDPNARAGVVDDGTDVTEVINANYGNELTRAKTYRGLVEAVSYVMAMEHAPAIRLTVQVLINREFDPT